jgi:hypothetical protein
MQLYKLACRMLILLTNAIKSCNFYIASESSAALRPTMKQTANTRPLGLVSVQTIRILREFFIFADGLIQHRLASSSSSQVYIT